MALEKKPREKLAGFWQKPYGLWDKIRDLCCQIRILNLNLTKNWELPTQKKNEIRSQIKNHPPNCHHFINVEFGRIPQNPSNPAFCTKPNLSPLSGGKKPKSSLRGILWLINTFFLYKKTSWLPRSGRFNLLQQASRREAAVWLAAAGWGKKVLAGWEEQGGSLRLKKSTRPKTADRKSPVYRMVPK